ncbi:alpha-L-fucosidase [Echinicola soli]|uniref:alpha-L-fucosidase n=2 Tax=Echinicola soli TaxID=2591634 RepID=A0A514CP13_9BACT|nr:alpha-L-fucosidase [Echinicola soli]
MEKMWIIGCIGLMSFLTPSLEVWAQQIDVPVPSPAQIAWQEAELTVIFHYDLHVFDGKKYVQSNNRITPIPDYNIFNPEALDTDQWVRAAKGMGAKIAMLTATHETGFALYQSDVNPYCMKALKWQDGKGDIVQDFVTSCRKYGIKPGIYIGIRWNSFYGIHDFEVSGQDEFAKNRQAHYNRMCEGMVEELTSKYGELAIIWFDGGAHGPAQGGPDVQGIVESNQPNALFYHNLDRADIRWGGSESGAVPYPCWGTYGHPSWFANRGDSIDFRPIKYGDPNGAFYMPAMSDAPLRGYNGRHEWFWEPGDEAHIYPLENLMEMYYNSVGHNSTLILGIAPDERGLVPNKDVERMREFGDEISARFNDALAKVSGTGKEISVPLGKSLEVGTVVIEEDVRFGERVREFLIQGKTKGQWVDLYKGTSIGHKHIAVFSARKVDSVRLQIHEAIGDPKIASIKVYD